MRFISKFLREKLIRCIETILRVHKTFKLVDPVPVEIIISQYYESEEIRENIDFSGFDFIQLLNVEKLFGETTLKLIDEINAGYQFIITRTWTDQEIDAHYKYLGSLEHETRVLQAYRITIKNLIVSKLQETLFI